MAEEQFTTNPSEETTKTEIIEETIADEASSSVEVTEELLSPEPTHSPILDSDATGILSSGADEPEADERSQSTIMADESIEPEALPQVEELQEQPEVTVAGMEDNIQAAAEEEVIQPAPGEDILTTAEENIQVAAEEVIQPAPGDDIHTTAEEQIQTTAEEESGEEEEGEEEEAEAAVEADEESLKHINELSKEQLVELLEETVRESDINKIKTDVALIKVAFLRLSKEYKDQHLEKYIREDDEKSERAVTEDPLDLRFEQAFETYKINKAKYTEVQEQIKLKNLQEKIKILDELKELINSEETLKKTYDHFRTLQDQWKEIGMVPKAEVNNLWQNYHFLVERFFDKVKINKELKDLDLRKNLEAKIKLCEKAEELLLETSILRSFKQLQKYHEEWKEIGPVAQDKKDEIWERFKTATDKINDRRREHYRKLQEEQQENYTTKLALCEKAEQIAAIRNNSLNDWQNTTQEISELLKIWRSIGPAGKKMNDKIWERFKTSLDTYFSEKKEYFGKVKDQQIHNYNLKLDLCVQAEALKNNMDWRKTTQDLIQLQKEWKEIGPVPRKHANRIWKRFRAACDEFFARKSNYFSSIQKQEEENLQLKLNLIKKVQDYELTGNKSDDLQVIKEMQREWMEIGHVPMKEKDRLQNDFRTAINKHLDKLKIDAMEISTLSFKAHYESVRDDPDANRILSKERGTLVNKLSKLKEDIALWENNIGFLADSKNAQILRKEFEKKIDNAKKEQAILEAKIKILNGQRS
ncbi:MAG: DUF349 domain-containing protein [Bacteroidales bacterium]|nr:DUF349 domain-containing protein [Lentimicrobiaceae bacterium]MDD5693942.1 DUF349 domain-containing protein [Bacteroidales bacterium]